LQVSATTTIEAMAAAGGYSNSAVVSGTYTIGPAPVSVNLSAAANVHGLVNTGSPVSGGGMDRYGYAYITLPSNRNVVVFAITLTAIYSNPACNPLNFGAVGDGTTDNTTAIQNAVNSCAKQGGGIVELSVVGSNAVYLTGPFTLQSNVQLEIDNGVTLQGTNDHSRYVGAYINWVYQQRR
jgi:hypothetical protein